MGRVTDVYLGTDGHVRVVDVKIQGKKLRKHVWCICSGKKRKILSFGGRMFTPTDASSQSYYIATIILSRIVTIH